MLPHVLVHVSDHAVRTVTSLPKAMVLIVIPSRGLSLWYADRTLLIALEVAKAFAPCVEFMMMIWPSPSEPDLFDSSLSSHALRIFLGQRKEYEALRNWLVRSCMIAGVSPPERAIPIVPSARSRDLQTNPIL